MNKRLEQFSIKLEELLRNNKSIVKNRSILLFNMFGGTPFEDEIKKILSNHSLYNYFLIGKILFLIDNLEETLKNTNKLIELLKNEKYLIITDNFKIEDLENLLLSITEKSENIQKEDQINIENRWDSCLVKIKDLDVTVIAKPDSTYFNFDNSIGTQFKLSQIITPDFEKACKQLFESKPNNYQNYKLENALFLEILTTTLKNRSDLDKCIGISKDKVSDFKIIHNNLNQKKDWNNLSWKEIKNLKKEMK
ncbi:MAG: hypothetical protein ACRC5S_11775 [Cetobacterium sp.]